MRWFTFIIAAYLAYVFDAGLRGLLSIGGVSPSFLLILAVFIGLSAPSMAAAWAMLILGALADLLPGGNGILGPWALGYLFGAFALMQVRGLVFRESPITLGVMVFVGGIFVQLLTLAVLSMRGWSIFAGEPIAGFHWADQFVKSFLVLLYSAAAAVPVGMMLFRTERLWGFHPQKIR
jgi:hypothetical protein